MPKFKPLPDIEYLRSILEYDEGSPKGLRWKSRPRKDFSDNRGFLIFNRRDAGNLAGTGVRRGGSFYYTVKINQVSYPSHRIIWAIVKGEDPGDFEIDHKDRDSTNNKIENLRVSTRSENASNKSIQSNNTSGFRGVVWCKRTQLWMAQIGKEGKNLFLGRYKNLDDAVKARAEASKNYHLEFAGKAF
jgi:hypothetical protein